MSDPDTAALISGCIKDAISNAEIDPGAAIKIATKKIVRLMAQAPAPVAPDPNEKLIEEVRDAIRYGGACPAHLAVIMASRLEDLSQELKGVYALLLEKAPVSHD